MSALTAFLHVVLKFAMPACLVFLLGSALYGYLSPQPSEPINVVWAVLAAFGTWYFWLRSTRKGVT